MITALQYHTFDSMEKLKLFSSEKALDVISNFARIRYKQEKRIRKAVGTLPNRLSWPPPGRDFIARGHGRDPSLQRMQLRGQSQDHRGLRPDDRRQGQDREVREHEEAARVQRAERRL